MPDAVRNLSNTIGFVDISDLETEDVTRMSLSLLEDFVAAAQVLDGPGSYGADVAVVESDDDTPPALVLTTEYSGDVGVMIASRRVPDDGDE